MVETQAIAPAGRLLSEQQIRETLQAGLADKFASGLHVPPPKPVSSSNSRLAAASCPFAAAASSVALPFAVVDVVVAGGATAISTSPNPP